MSDNEYGITSEKCADCILLVLQYAKIFLKLNSDHQGSDEKRWRNDGKCGLRYPLSDGSPTECDPHGYRPCCGISGVCGNTTSICNFPGSIDYREVWNWRQAGGSGYMPSKLLFYFFLRHSLT